MNKQNGSKTLFEKGLNCAQSILFTYGKDYFKENSSAFKLASAFGAGISYRGGMCGAVSGALMVIGLNYGYTDLTIDVSKETLCNISKEFIETFSKHNGSVLCNTLIGCEINTPEGLQNARQKDLFNKVCPKLIEDASEIIEMIFERYPLPLPVGK
jgi:C_GCAxxG_C_C family probable redox protein